MNKFVAADRLRVARANLMITNIRRAEILGFPKFTIDSPKIQE